MATRANYLSYRAISMAVFQTTSAGIPSHQVGQIAIAGALYRPRVVRAVVNRLTRRLRRRPPHARVQHRHDVFHVVSVAQGTGHCMLNDRLQSIRPGSFLFVSPGEPHHLAVDMARCRYSNVTFEFLNGVNGKALSIPLRELLECITGSPMEAPDSFPLVAAAPDALGKLRSDAERLVDEAVRSEVGGAHALLAYLIDVADACFRTVLPPGGPSDPRLEQARSHIRAHYADRLSLDELARRVHMSRRNLTRRFREAYGISPIALQQEHRINAASMMLRTTDLQVQQIADEVGFNDIYQFSRAFRKRAGVSPKAYRRLSRGS